MNFQDFTFVRPPKHYALTDHRAVIVTEPHTDLWQRTYYHFRNDSAPLLLAESDERYFTFTVKCDFSGSHTRFDQGGIVLYLDSENWIKASVEYENEVFQHLGSVVTNDGYSDWATTETDAALKTVWYRLNRREDDYKIECSFDGKRFCQMRICHLTKGGGRIRFGVYAASPEESSFEAIFTDPTFGACQWQAHDGQPPDA